METSTKSYRIAVIPGDGIGIEVMQAAVAVLEELCTREHCSLQFCTFDWNSQKYLQNGVYIPEGALEDLKSFDAVLFGAVGDTSVPDHISLWGLILPLRQKLRQIVNIRPIRSFKGKDGCLSAKVGQEIDWVIIRENSEGEYAGQGGITHADTEDAVATEVAIFTRRSIERVMRFAFETAQKRPRKMLTVVTKSNAQRYGMVLWDSVFESLSLEYPDVKSDKMLVDAMTVRMVNHPLSLDTIVASNLHGDILSDLAAALAGSIGVAPSSNINPDRSSPGLFEPIHGSAPDIAGKGIANPIAMIWSAAEMLKWLGEEGLALKVMQSVQRTIDAGIVSRDMGGTATTEEVANAIIRRLEE